MGDFVSDVAAIRRRARQHIEKGPVTDGYKADLPRVIEVLNGVLATEIVCVLRYKRHYFTADGINAQPVAQEFLQHANEEQQHADWVAQRIVQLGGAPNLNPEGLAQRSHSQYDEKASLLDMIREDLVAERIAIESYAEITRWLGNDDPTTRVLIENILKMEEEHADDLRTLLATFAPRPRRQPRRHRARDPAWPVRRAAHPLRHQLRLERLSADAARGVRGGAAPRDARRGGRAVPGQRVELPDRPRGPAHLRLTHLQDVRRGLRG